MFIKILSFDVFSEKIDDFMNYIEKLDKVNIVSGNPSILLNGFYNKELNKNFKEKYSVIIPDGIGTVIASKLLKTPVKEKIAGFDIAIKLLEKGDKEGKSVYLLGTKQDILEECVKRIKHDYKNLKIVGYHNGFFDINNCDNLINEIEESKPWAIFVAMGSPRQEIFINKIIHRSNIDVFMAVGGVFDILSGKLKRAPKWMIKFGLEWLYRVIVEPFRIKRLFKIPEFIFKALEYKYIGEKNEKRK
ncbi:WecB/TagA/CpsF family glycosyltransferase [Clostridium sp. BJN0001]|uniref:WecB/TagA/CpsF family glycosyltransferase n=1 Tax=Clostridium sp. BJN0001 TaxID=2930219 RepID=UPI001FD590ED|nr:WecB/TagA/CpsF family glycosyltransferase [Clostridium sp. BJN0001]